MSAWEMIMLRLSTAYGAFGVSISAYIVSQLLIKSRFERLGVADAFAQSIASGAGLIVRDSACWFAGLLVVTGGLCWYIAMTRLPIHLMVPMAAVITPAASVGAFLFLGEHLSLEKMMAIGLITIGVVWLGSLGL
jgi:drug/metabolite transporter (DMT)-like permease